MADLNEAKRNPFLKSGKKEEKNTNKTDTPLQHKLARHKVLMIYRICFVVALVGVFLVCAYIHWKNLQYTDYEVKQQYEWSRSQEAHSINLANTLFTYSKDGMSCTDAKGKVIWNQTYEMQDTMVRTCSNVVAVGDYNGRNIYVSDTTGNLGTIDTTMPIRDFCVASNGVVAAVLDDSTVTAIYLYSVAGEQLAYFKTTMSKSGYPVAIAISDDGRQIAVSYLKAENGKVTSSVGFYNFSSVGQNYTDNLVGGYGYADAVVPLISFMNNDTVFAVADNRLMFYQGRQKPVSLTDILISEEIQSVFYDKDHVGLVFYNSGAETTYRMELYDTSGKKVRELAFDLEYKDIIFDTAGIIIYNDESCVIYDWDGRLKYQGDFRNRVECMIPTGNIARYTLVTTDSIQNIQLQ